MNQEPNWKKVQNIPLKNLSTDELEKVAKIVQREVNRRVDSARRHADIGMTDTLAYKRLESEGERGIKIALSNFSDQKTKADRRAWLMKEITRGRKFLSAETTTYTGFTKNDKRMAQNVAKSMGLGDYNSDGSFTYANEITQKTLWTIFRDRNLKSAFWNMYNQFKEEFVSEYSQWGSERMIDLTYDYYTLFLEETMTGKIKEGNEPIDSKEIEYPVLRLKRLVYEHMYLGQNSLDPNNKKYVYAKGKSDFEYVNGILKLKDKNKDFITALNWDGKI